MIDIIPIERGYITKSTKYLVFIDDIFVGEVEKEYIINPEYEKFIIEYETLNKQQRNTVNCPVKWIFNGYKPCLAWYENLLNPVSISICETEEKLEIFFRNLLSKNSVIENYNYNVSI